MRSDLKIYYIPPHTPEWYAFRQNGIGGSEVGDICGLTKPEYNRTIYHFHNKVGDVVTEVPDNPKMFAGRFLEDKIAELWEFWDGSELGYIENYRNNRVVRSCRKLNGIVVNPKYPWLFGSIDRLMNIKNSINLLTGQALKNEGVIEIKNMSYNASRVWEDGTPPSYIAQIQTYMVILEVEYGELATLIDGNEFSVTPFERDNNLCESIVNVTKAFWYNKVLPAKQAFAKKQEAEKSGNIYEMEKHDAIIQQCEPEPDSSNAYRDFMNKRFLKERSSIEGNMRLYEMCKKDKVLNGISSIIEEERSVIKNTLIKELTLSGAESIDFGRIGAVTWDERKGFKNRVLNNRIKEKPSEEQLMAEYKKLNLECY